MKLIPNWKSMWRAWSVRLNAIGLVFMGWVFFDPSAALMLLNSMPSEVRALLPGNALSFVSFAIYGTAIIARMVKQPKLQEKIDASQQ